MQAHSGDSHVGEIFLRGNTHHMSKEEGQCSPGSALPPILHVSASSGLNSEQSPEHLSKFLAWKHQPDPSMASPDQRTMREFANHSDIRSRQNISTLSPQQPHSSNKNRSGADSWTDVSASHLPQIDSSGHHGLGLESKMTDLHLTSRQRALLSPLSGGKPHDSSFTDHSTAHNNSGNALLTSPRAQLSPIGADSKQQSHSHLFLTDETVKGTPPNTPKEHPDSKDSPRYVQNLSSPSATLHANGQLLRNLSPIVRSSDTLSVKMDNLHDWKTGHAAEEKQTRRQSPIWESGDSKRNALHDDDEVNMDHLSSRRTLLNSENNQAMPEEEDPRDAVSPLSWSDSERERVRETQSQWRRGQQERDSQDDRSLPSVNPHPPSVVSHPAHHRQRISNARNFVDNS